LGRTIAPRFGSEFSSFVLAMQDAGNSVCIPGIASGITATGAAERQNVSSRGWSVAQPPESKSWGPCRGAASQASDGRVCCAATRLVLVSAGDRGFRCAPPPAIRVAPLRGGCRTIASDPALPVPRSGKT
jgi:hypothetical protein